MGSNSFFGRLRKHGFVMLSYTLAKSLGLVNAVVLERILTEYQHSKSYYLCKCGWFVINYEEIAFHLGLTVEEVEEAVNELTGYDFIKATEDEGLMLVKIYEEELINFARIEEINNKYKIWDYMLMPIQQQILSLDDI